MEGPSDSEWFSVGPGPATARPRPGGVVDRRCRRQRCHRGTGGSGTSSGWTFIIICQAGNTHAWSQPLDSNHDLMSTPTNALKLSAVF